MAEITKLIGVRLDIENHKRLNEIVKRTGETKVELFKRLVSSEHKRIIKGEPQNESLSLQIEQIATAVNEMLPLTKKISEHTSATREGTNRIWCAIIFTLKELFRTMHFISGCFANSSLLLKEHLSIIGNTADQEATNTFGTAYKILKESQPKDVVEILLKK